YSYPENTRKFNNEIKEIEYFPDKILSFGDYWKNACPFPIDSENIISMGFPYFEENSKIYMKIAEDKNSEEENNEKTDYQQALFISQGVIGKYLSELAYETASNINENNDSQNFKFIYKLHPGEYGTWRENYDYLTKAVDEFENFTVIDKSKPQLYELFAKSHYQIGAFSTAIYEGLAFNCKTFIIDVPGVEYLDDLIDKDIVKKVKNSEELINYINNENISIQEYDKDYFFKNFDETIFKNILSD
ncbi:MAG: sialyltransferase, partial [Methanobrevibacter sp.]|nr:sialyltransferase [Methanobrevibacter sp.]